MAVRPIDGNSLIEWFRPYLHTGEPIPADVVIENIRSMPTLTPQNEPLTMDELLKMDGEPVWVKCLKPSQYADPPVRWRILEKSITGNFGVWNGDCALIERTYGVDWLAYRRPLEGET